MQGRTHRWFEGEPAYPFGFGLSYATFGYSGMRVERSGRTLRGSVTVANRGPVAAREIVQVYLTGFTDDGQGPVPRENLVFFRAVDLAPGEEQEVPFRITAAQMHLVDMHGRRTRRPRAFEVFAGGSSPHPRCRVLGAPAGCRQRITLDS